MLRSTLRALGVLTAATAAVLFVAGPASAHVTVNPEEAEQGGYAKLSFRVPNESDEAGTTKLKVSFPTDTPLGSVLTKPVDGWTAKVTTKQLDEPVNVGDYDIEEAVTAVTWTAGKGVRINPGEFQEFDISAGPLPSNAQSMMFPAVQTYDDGEVVSWDQPTEEGAEEPEHPAPTLALVEGSGDHGAAAKTSQTSDSNEGATDGTEAHDDTAAVDSTARTLGTVGIGGAVLGLIVALGTVFAVRKKDTKA